MAQRGEKKTLIHWFRKGLRLHDNPALLKVFKLANESPQRYWVRPIFILDKDIPEWVRVGDNRWRFLQQTLADLHEQLRRHNSRLYVVRGTPAEVFPRLFADWQASLLTYEYDIEPYSMKRDAAVGALARAADVKVETFISHTIYNPELVLRGNAGKAPGTYRKFQSVVEKMSLPRVEDRPAPLVAKCEAPAADSLEQADAKCYDCPQLSELVRNPSRLGRTLYPGGETEGLLRMEKSLMNKTWVTSFEKPKTSPNSLEPSTTVLSPYLKFGCVSARLYHQRLLEILKSNPKHTKPPVSLVGQLLWREFYYTAAASEPNFDRMVGNSFCIQIPWQSNPAHLDAWAHGRTGYPFIDAIMRQLRQEGWIHHLARHAVACFLTRGDLWISWEEGQKVFEELLLDQDWALNAGNWMWLSASAFFHQFFRVYSPVAFGKKTDHTGRYIRKYVPELAHFPSGLIYEPWTASLEVQRRCGCILGTDYPNRIVVHEEVLEPNLKRMTEAYKVNREVRQQPTPTPENSDKRLASTQADDEGGDRASKRRKT